MNIKPISVAIISALLVACNGGGGSSSTDVGSSEETRFESVGVFVDSPVSGLYYETPTRSGLTNSQGEFTYLDGETVTFSLGKTILGAATGAEIVTPFSLFNMKAPTRESEISAMLISSDISNYDRAMNVATLLQTLDLDSNPSNGINLGSAHDELADISIDLSAKATKFGAEASLETAISGLGISSVPDFEDVASHLYESLGLDVKSDLVNEISAEVNARQTITTSLGHDDDDNITARNIDTDSDGLADDITTFSYDDAGNLTGTSNSVTNTSETLTYDENNNLVSHLTDKLRQPDIEQKFIFNSDNTLSAFEVDHGADGSVDGTVTYDYDEQGKLISYTVDQDNDGIANATAQLEYEGSEVSSYSEDADNDGSENLNITYQYDSAGNRTSQQVVGEGMLNNAATFEYDANGNVTRYEQDNDLDGSADYVEASEYDANSNRTTYRRDLDADGVWDSITLYTYDIDGNRTSMQEDSNGDGTIDKQWSTSYDTETIDNGWQVIMSKVESEG